MSKATTLYQTNITVKAEYIHCMWFPPYPTGGGFWRPLMTFTANICIQIRSHKTWDIFLEPIVGHSDYIDLHQKKYLINPMKFCIFWKTNKKQLLSILSSCRVKNHLHPALISHFSCIYLYPVSHNLSGCNMEMFTRII